jgi:dTDP-4-dehydrorhamnose 3,5-epimerase
MRFVPTSVTGAYVIEPAKIRDERGFFARGWCEEEFRSAGLCTIIKQSNMAANPLAGTLRGLHFQRAPHEEVKVVRCVKGAIFDVVVDLRPASPSYLKWYGVELNDQNDLALYVPCGCATGYLTLVADAAMQYHTSERYAPSFASGVRFDDPAIGIAWPIEPTLISAQDRSWPYLAQADKPQ